jgi:UDP-N-acetylmuramate dehydrogenase
MPVINKNISLLPFNTFHFDCLAGHFTILQSEEDIQHIIQQGLLKDNQAIILGGGSNILLTKDLPQHLIIKNEIKGIQILQETSSYVLVEAGAGENWHDFVMHCIENDWGGLENLSLIPGTVGAAPMQNIGAYGVEIKDCLAFVKAIDKQSGEEKLFSKEQCNFGYRESIFKKEAKDQYIITRVAFQLTKNNHQFRVTYGVIQQVLSEMKISNLTLRAVSDAVISIRKSKLPDPAVLGNAGSFFKNPEIDIQQYKQLQNLFPNIPSFPINEHMVKIPAAWLIEQCGWKGKKVGNVGVHAHQALVLIHYGNGKGEDVLMLAKQIQQSVMNTFTITLQMEVNVI